MRTESTDLSDAALNERLREMTHGFVPADGFAHVRQQLRQGRTYIAWAGSRDSGSIPYVLGFGGDWWVKVLKRLRQSKGRKG